MTNIVAIKPHTADLATQGADDTDRRVRGISWALEALPKADHAELERSLPPRAACAMLAEQRVPLSKLDGAEARSAALATLVLSGFPARTASSEPGFAAALASAFLEFPPETCTLAVTRAATRIEWLSAFSLRELLIACDGERKEAAKRAHAVLREYRRRDDAKLPKPAEGRSAKPPAEAIAAIEAMSGDQRQAILDRVNADREAKGKPLFGEMALGVPSMLAIGAMQAGIKIDAKAENLTA